MVSLAEIHFQNEQLKVAFGSHPGNENAAAVDYI